MPTRAEAAAAAAEARCITAVLSADALSLVLCRLTLAHDIAATATTCHAFCDAAKLALLLRPFSGNVITLVGHNELVESVGAIADGLVITSSYDRTMKVWNGSECVRSIDLAQDEPHAVVCGERLVTASGSTETISATVMVWNINGDHERTIYLSSYFEQPGPVSYTHLTLPTILLV